MKQEQLKEAVWIAHTLFQRGSAAGSSANISFRCENEIYISGSGTCFGTLTEGQFACMTFDGKRKNEVIPSKEFPLHQILYQARPYVNAVIHTHSPYAVLYSCLKQENETDILPSFTPYLKMKVGTIGRIPYYRPGSEELFDAMRRQEAESDGFILKRHGPVIPGKSLMDAFFGIEELEESAKIAWHLIEKKEFDNDVFG